MYLATFATHKVPEVANALADPKAPLEICRWTQEDTFTHPSADV